MPKRLPPLASVEWLKKAAKRRLSALRQQQPDARLADAQHALAKDYGYPSWRALKVQLESRSGNELEVAAFLRAVADGRIHEVAESLEHRPGLVNAIGPHPFWGGRPQPLHVAIEMQQRAIFDLLLKSGAEVNGSNRAYGDWTPLMIALSRNRSDMAETLVEHGASIGLFEALMMKDDARVDELLADGLPDKAPGLASALAFARTPSAVHRLLCLGADPLKKDASGRTPLDLMSSLGASGRPLVKQMAKDGVTPTPVHAARVGDSELVRRLLRSDPGLVRDDDLLIAAVDSRDAGLVRDLLAAGASPNAHSSDETRHSALHAAAWNGDLEIVKLLVDAGARTDERDARHDSTPWGWAKTAETITRNPDCRAVADWFERRSN